MKQTLFPNSHLRLVVMFIALVSFSMTACTKDKKESNDAEKFGGTWNGTASCNGGTGGSGQLVFTATDNKTVTTNYSIGTGSCVVAKTLTGTASGDNVTFNTVTLTDGCGLSYSISAYGSLSGGTFTFTISSNGAANGSCTFSGTK